MLYSQYQDYLINKLAMKNALKKIITIKLLPWWWLLSAQLKGPQKQNSEQNATSLTYPSYKEIWYELCLHTLHPLPSAQFINNEI